MHEYDYEKLNGGYIIKVTFVKKRQTDYCFNRVAAVAVVAFVFIYCLNLCVYAST